MKIHKNSVSGVALIIVLGFLVIISALTVAFFSSVNTELKASRNFAAGITTRQLADSSVQIVMGQIANATTRGIDTLGQGHEAWASQPGMIRVFGTNSGGNYQESNLPDAFFKLYSSDKMTLTGTDVGQYTPTSDYQPAWDASPAYWTDLNAPVIIRDANGLPTPRFPIIDPRAYATAIDPSKPDWTNNVEGFYYDVNAGVNGMVGPGSPDAQRLPMPVRWIYVLQDGTLTTADKAGTGTTATFATAAKEKQPSQANPIVGRIAFWTDDETCKLNLNTAAGHSDNVNQLNTAYQNSLSSYAGSYWDTPRFYTQFEYGIPSLTGNPLTQNGVPDPNKASGGLALCQLLQNEFQRYPGHPATTSLAPVLHSLLNSEQIYAIVPRYTNLNLTNALASTKGGTERVIVDPINTPGDLDNKELQPKNDRLYATLDELMFAAHVKGVPSTNPLYARVSINTGVYPALSGNAFDPINPQLIDKMRFFVSTQGRSPELNLFGQPRVTCWPVRSENNTSDTTGMNVFDNLIFFCSTVGAPPQATTGRPDSKTDMTAQGVYRYAFTRREVTGMTIGTHQDILGMNQKQYEFPASYVYDSELPRNKYLLGTYLNNMTSRAIPGTAGKKFSDKYADTDRQGFLTEMFDYIRLANSQDTTTSLAPPAKAIKFAPQGMVKPSLPTYFKANGIQAKGFGRMSTLCEASLVFYYAGPEMDGDAGGTIPKKTDANYNGGVPKGANPPWNAAQINAWAAQEFVPLDAVSNGYLANTGWSRWDPLNPNKRYVKIIGYDPDKSTLDAQGKPVLTRLPNYGQVHGGYMRAFILFSTFDPMQGYAPKADPADTDPKMTIECTWPADFTVGIEGDPANKALGFPVGSAVSTTIYRAPASSWAGRNVGGYEGFQHTLHGAGTAARPFKIMWLPPNASGAGATFMNPNVPGTTMPVDLNSEYGETWCPAPPSPTSPQGSYIRPKFNTGGYASAIQEYYPFQTDARKAILVSNNAKRFSFTGGHILTKIYYGGGTALQQFDLVFPNTPLGVMWPVPQGAPQGFKDSGAGEINPIQKTTAKQNSPSPDPATWLAMPTPTANTQPDINFGPIPVGAAPNGVNFPLLEGMRSWYWTGNGTFFANTALGVRTGSLTAQRSGVNFETSLQASWAFASRLAWVDFANGDSSDAHTNSGNGAVDPGWWGDRWRCIVQPGDTIRSLIYWDGKDASSKQDLKGEGAITGGDLRIAALSSSVPTTEFQPHPDYLQPYSRACILRAADGSSYFPVGSVQPLVGSSGGANKTAGAPAVVYASAGASGAFSNPAPNIANIATSPGNDSTREAGLGNHIYLGTNKLKFPTSRAFGNLPWGGYATDISQTSAVNGVMRRESGGGGTYPGDFDSGMGDFPDGPFCNKQDEGNVIYKYFDSNTQQWVFPIPYFTSTWTYQTPGNTFTSPSRQMPSPAMFGSLPSRPADKGGLGWTTLSFAPNTAGDQHPGNVVEPKDHYLLDLFQMPVVEPYPITEPFSTAGKVNLNYRIAPFDYIRRSTALRGALYPLRVTAVASQYQQPSASSNYLVYKTGTAATPGYPSGTPLTTNFRLRLDRDETMKAIDGFLDSGLTDPTTGFFKSASQICERYFYSQDSGPMKYPGTPDAETDTMRTWWKTFGDLTGDNVREKPYVDLYPRVCTKSNTYTVHMKVQTLRQTPGHFDQWIEGKDAVLGEYRGSATIERYLDPADPRFSPTNSPSLNPDSKSLEPLYRFRTVYSRKFTP